MSESRSPLRLGAGDLEDVDDTALQGRGGPAGEEEPDEPEDHDQAATADGPMAKTVRAWSTCGDLRGVVSSEGGWLRCVWRLAGESFDTLVYSIRKRIKTRA